MSMNQGNAARRRGRGGVSRAGVVLLGAAGVVLFIGLSFVVAAYRAEPLGVENAKQRAAARAFGAEVQPEGGENAWPLYQQIFGEWRSLDARKREVDLGRIPTVLYPLLRGEWKEEEAHGAGLEAWDALAPLVEQLEEAARMPRMMPPEEWVTWVEESPDKFTMTVNGFGKVKLLPTIGMRVAAERGDWEAMDRHLETGLLMARQMSALPGSTIMVISPMAYELPLEELRRLIVEHAIPASACNRMVETIETVTYPAGSWESIIEGWRISTSANLGKYFDSSGRMVVWTIDQPAWADRDPEWLEEALERVSNVRRYWWPRRGAVEASLFEIAGDAQEMIGRAPHAWERVGTPRGRSGQCAMRRSDGFALAFEAAVRVIESRRGTLVMLRLERFRAQEGRWPRDLLEAMSQEEATNPVTGELFVYERGSDEEGAGYRLWPAAPGEGRVAPEWPRSRPLRDPPETLTKAREDVRADR